MTQIENNKYQAPNNKLQKIFNDLNNSPTQKKKALKNKSNKSNAQD